MYIVILNRLPAKGQAVNRLKRENAETLLSPGESNSPRPSPQNNNTAQPEGVNAATKELHRTASKGKVTQPMKELHRTATKGNVTQPTKELHNAAKKEQCNTVHERAIQRSHKENYNAAHAGAQRKQVTHQAVSKQNRPARTTRV